MAVQEGIDIFSSVPLYVMPKFGESKLSDATGFLWFKNGQHWLITNWHVVSGRHPETEKCLHSQAGVPDRLTVFFQNIDLQLDPIEVDVSLFDEETPTWSEHPDHGRKVDLAAIKIDVPHMSEANYCAINAIKSMDLRQRVGDRCYILGFPFGRQGYGFPVWKGGTFASEPYLSKITNEPILVDSASRPGVWLSCDPAGIWAIGMGRWNDRPCSEWAWRQSIGRNLCGSVAH
ncbi:MAG: trypsin-like peptidase domain-containing protein [Sphingomonadales bacterium]|nr:trypsin-like peptidase domain-containing protein [Sphingomonadales bacterium]